MLERQTVLVEGGRIRAIGPVRDVPPPGLDSLGERQIVNTLARGSEGVVMVTDD